MLYNDLIDVFFFIKTHDIEAMVRHSLEFNFTIAAFHHALDGKRAIEMPNS